MIAELFDTIGRDNDPLAMTAVASSRRMHPPLVESTKLGAGDPRPNEYLLKSDWLEQQNVLPRKVNYTDESLYGVAGRSHREFQAAIRALTGTAKELAVLNPLEVEYSHRMTLFWCEVGQLKKYLGSSAVVSEIVAELQTARFQMLRKDTPVSFIKAIAEGLMFVAGAYNPNTAMVDKMVLTFEAGGFDSLAPEALRKSDG